MKVFRVRPRARTGDGDLPVGMLSGGDCEFSEVESNLKRAPLSAHVLSESLTEIAKTDKKRINALSKCYLVTLEIARRSAIGLGLHPAGLEPATL